MRRETNHARGLLLFEQIGEKALECDLSLRERSLIKSGKDFSRLDQRDEFLEEIGRDHLDLAKQSFFLKSLEDRDAVRRANVQTLRLRLSVQQCHRLAISFLGTLMRFDRRQEAKVGSQHRQRGRESAKFLGVIEGGKFPRDGGDIGLAGELMRQKFGSQSTACVRVCGDQTDASASGSIAGHAKHCGALRRQAVDDRIKLSWVAGGEDDAVAPILQSRLEQLDVSLPHPGILMEGDLYVHSNRSICRGTYPGTQRVEEVRDLLRKNDGDLDSAVELQCHGSEVRLIAYLLGHIEYACFGFQADARTIMQNTVNCADRNTERSGDFFDSTCFGCVVHRVRSRGEKYQSHVTAIPCLAHSPFLSRSRRSDQASHVRCAARCS